MFLKAGFFLEGSGGSFFQRVSLYLVRLVQTTSGKNSIMDGLKEQLVVTYTGSSAKDETEQKQKREGERGEKRHHRSLRDRRAATLAKHHASISPWSIDPPV